MKFRTEIDIRPFGRKIGYDSRLLAVGSCFADNMAAAMSRAKFRITANPAGVLFNPASIAESLRMFASGDMASAENLTESGGRFFDYRLHGSFADSSPERALRKINDAIRCGSKALEQCDTVIITFGTAWVYILNATGRIVANCHKQPSEVFTRRRMTVDEIVELFSELFDGILNGKNVILTVSPVRHLGDGADENFLSKATLKLAAAALVDKYPNAAYFPAYEILNDDLRDYRFYADDLVHPSSQAIAYVRDKFFGAVLSEQTRSTLARVEKVVSAAEHRPFDSDSEAFRTFCRRALTDIDALLREAPDIDFTAERDYFTAFLQ